MIVRANHHTSELGDVFRLAFERDGLTEALNSVATTAVLYSHGVLGHPDKLSSLRLVAATMGTTCAMLRTKCKETRFVETRWIAMWLLRQHGQPWARLSYPEIGEQLGRDHSTAIHGVAKVEASPELLARARAFLVAKAP